MKFPEINFNPVVVRKTIYNQYLKCITFIINAKRINEKSTKFLFKFINISGYEVGMNLFFANGMSNGILKTGSCAGCFQNE